MRIAPRRTEKPHAEVFKNQEFPVKFDLVRFDEEAFTLATVELPDNTVVTAGAMLNPIDQLNRRVGREQAYDRLESYLCHGVARRHKDGRKADHFVVELEKSELVSGWKRKAAELMFEGTFLSVNPFEITFNLQQGAE